MQVALDALVSGGVENVRINKLARTLSISKSGFYWHFRNRDHLLQEMTRFWVNEYSRRIISDLIEKEEAPKSKLLKLVHLIRESEAGVFDLAFTAWAKRDENIHTTLDEVRELRMNFVKKILSPNYCSDAEVEARARLFIVYFSWSEVMFSKSDAALEEEPLDQILEIIVGKT